MSFKELLRDSVTAPFILKIHDTPSDDAIERRIDLWFVVRGDLGKIDPVRLADASSGKAVEVGNMRFETRLLKPEELKAKGLSAIEERNLSRWFVDLNGRLLSRIAFEAVDEAMASRTSKSMVIASRMSKAFDGGDSHSNHWRTISAEGTRGPNQPFAGGASYAKISRLEEPTGALLVELHAAFNEPRGWFQGQPILRSKFAIAAQDQIRRLRRELESDRAKSSP
jgi:hypothetical protein